LVKVVRVGLVLAWQEGHGNLCYVPVSCCRAWWNKAQHGMAGVERYCEFRSVGIRIVTVSNGRIGMVFLVPASMSKAMLVVEWQERRGL